MKPIITLAIIAALLFAIFGNQFLTITGSNNPTFNLFRVGTHATSPGYKVGDLDLKFSEPFYDCALPVGFKGVLEYPQDKQCWKVYVNGQKQPFAQDLNFESQGFTLKNTQARVSVYCEDNECELLQSGKQYTANYDVQLAKDAITLTKFDDKNTFALNEQEPFKITAQTKLPKNTPIGIAVQVNERIIQKTTTYEIKTLVTSNETTFTIPFLFDTIGEKTIIVKPFAELYDYRKDFTGENTGLCTKDDKTQQLICVQKTRTPTGASETVQLFSSPNTCTSSQECGGNYACINSKCVLVENKTDFEVKKEQVLTFLQKIIEWLKGWLQ